MCFQLPQSSFKYWCDDGTIMPLAFVSLGQRHWGPKFICNCQSVSQERHLGGQRLHELATAVFQKRCHILKGAGIIRAKKKMGDWKNNLSGMPEVITFINKFRKKLNLLHTKYTKPKEKQYIRKVLRGKWPAVASSLIVKRASSYQ